MAILPRNVCAGNFFNWQEALLFTLVCHLVVATSFCCCACGLSIGLLAIHIFGQGKQM